MHILFVATELSPYVRHTDAAETISGLAKALRGMDHEVTVGMPYSPAFEAAGLMMARRLTPLTLPGGQEVTVLDVQLSSGVKLKLFQADSANGLSRETPDSSNSIEAESKEAGLLCQAVVAFIQECLENGEAIHGVHAHGWQAAMVPWLLRRSPVVGTPAVLTIHDIAAQGVLPSERCADWGLDAATLTENDLRQGDSMSALQAGLLSADAATTVSESYAEAVRFPSVGGALADLFRARDISMSGIPVGIDYATWNPATDTVLAGRFDGEDSAQKGVCKTAFLRSIDQEEWERPLVLALDGLTSADGDGLLLGALPDLMKEDVSLVIATRAESASRAQFEKSAEKYADRCVVLANPSEATVHRAYAAADIVLSGAEHKPCHPTLMRGARYGCLPVTFGQGGARDMVIDCDSALETGTGFLYETYTPAALVGSLRRALAGYRHLGWLELRRRVMRLDTSWDRPARRYEQLFRNLLVNAG